MAKCIIHRWFYVSSTNGSKNLFTGKLIKREDRFCKDCPKMQLKLSQFTLAQQHELLKMTKSCRMSEWIDFKENDKIDKLTMLWLKTTSLG